MSGHCTAGIQSFVPGVRPESDEIPCYVQDPAYNEVDRHCLAAGTSRPIRIPREYRMFFGSFQRQRIFLRDYKYKKDEP